MQPEDVPGDRRRGTDSTNLATVAIAAARELVASQYGPEYLPAEPRIYLLPLENKADTLFFAGLQKVWR